MVNKDVLEIADTVARVTPPATVSFLSFSNVFLSNTVYSLTIVYIIFQIILMLPKVKRIIKPKSKEVQNE